MKTGPIIDATEIVAVTIGGDILTTQRNAHPILEQPLLVVEVAILPILILEVRRNRQLVVLHIRKTEAKGMRQIIPIIRNCVIHRIAGRGTASYQLNIVQLRVEALPWRIGHTNRHPLLPTQGMGILYTKIHQQVTHVVPTIFLHVVRIRRRKDQVSLMREITK